MSGQPSPVAGVAARSVNATLREVRYTVPSGDGTDVAVAFADPSPRVAVVASSPLDAPPVPFDQGKADVLVILTVATAPKDDPSMRGPWSRWMLDPPSTAPTVTIRAHGTEVLWRPGQAVIFGVAEQIEPLVAAVIEFAYYESELRKLEREIAAAWPDLDTDKRLAFDVGPGDMEIRESVGKRIAAALDRRIRYARLEPHFYRTTSNLPSAARKLADELREAAHLEDRVETVDGQLEVFEHVYEMCSQRIGEFRDAHRSHTLEWIIIVILSLEAIIMLIELLWNLQS